MIKITKNGQLDKLFEEWINEYKKEMDEYRFNMSAFAKDGIINEENYINTFPKLLFIAKETNRGGGDFRVWWREEVKYKFSKRIFEWAYGILNDFPDLDSIRIAQIDRKQIMSKISFMNLKKVPGESRANPDVIRATAMKFQKFILKEIKIICPDIIIGGIGDDTLWGKIFNFIKPKNSMNGRKLFKVENIKIVDFYHPSCRIPRAKLYSDLKDIISSEYFKVM